MDHLTQAGLLREKLLGCTEFELTGSDRATGDGYRVTVRRDIFDFAAFADVPLPALRQAVVDGLPVSIGATQYVVEPTFGDTYLKVVSDSARISVVSVTIQSHQRIVSLIGTEVSRLADLLGKWLPVTMNWEPESLVEGSREWGRKVGHAAKDLAGIGETAFGVDDLAARERSGESEAYDAACKKAVWPTPDFDELMQHGLAVSPRRLGRAAVQARQPVGRSWLAGKRQCLCSLRTGATRRQPDQAVRGRLAGTRVRPLSRPHAGDPRRRRGITIPFGTIEPPAIARRPHRDGDDWRPAIRDVGSTARDGCGRGGAEAMRSLVAACANP